MMCPECGLLQASQNKKLVIRPKDEIESVVRYYRCRACGHTYRTLETWIPDNMDPQTGEYVDANS